jgi:oligoendopeptidase F
MNPSNRWMPYGPALMGREYWVHEDGSFGGYLTPEEIAEKYRQLAEHYGQLSQAELDELREGWA